MGAMPRTPTTGIPRDVAVTTKMTTAEAYSVSLQAAARGFSDRSAYIRWVLRQDGARIKRERAQQ